jgi:hypothetical protein
MHILSEKIIKIKRLLEPVNVPTALVTKMLPPVREIQVSFGCKYKYSRARHPAAGGSPATGMGLPIG